MYEIEGKLLDACIEIVGKHCKLPTEAVAEIWIALQTLRNGPQKDPALEAELAEQKAEAERIAATML